MWADGIDKAARVASGKAALGPVACASTCDPFTVEDCDVHLIWLRRRLRRLSRQQSAESESQEEEDSFGRSAGRNPLAFGHRVYPRFGYRCLSINTSSRVVSMRPRVVVGPSVDPFTPDDFPGPGSYDLGKY
eukprot:scaffold287813_cov36-Tisochrysis_lutea.AAC.1